MVTSQTVIFIVKILSVQNLLFWTNKASDGNADVIRLRTNLLKLPVLLRQITLLASELQKEFKARLL